MKRIVISTLYLLVLFSISHFIFDPMYLYSDIKWLDIPMHILGGFGVASLTYGILLRLKKKASFGMILLAYTVVAVGWEFYEYWHDFVTYQGWTGWFDTIKDYVDGLLGAAIFYKFLTKK